MIGHQGDKEGEDPTLVIWEDRQRAELQQSTSEEEEHSDRESESDKDDSELAGANVDLCTNHHVTKAMLPHCQAPQATEISATNICPTSFLRVSACSTAHF